MNILRKTSLALGALLMIEASHSTLLEARGGGYHGGGHGDWHGRAGNWHGNNWHGGGYYGQNTGYYRHGGGWYGYGAPVAVGVGVGVVGAPVVPTNCWIDAYGNRHCNYY
jgi:hypothetical protein